MLRVYNLNKGYKKKESHDNLNVLKNISFHVNHGEIVSLFGPSGCGKTTLLRILVGLESATTGIIQWDGEKKEINVYLVFQEYNKSLFPWLTVKEHLQMVQSTNINNNKINSQDIDEILELTSLEKFKNFLPKELSGGMQQRLVLARAFIIKPKVLMLDEPFGSIDSYTRYKMEDSLLALANYFGITVIFVTHDIDEAIYMSDRIIVFTSMPATISDEFIISLPKPRNQRDTKSLDEYVLYRKMLYDKIINGL